MLRMKWNDFAFNVLSVKLQYFAVLSPSWRLMLQRNKMKEMLSEAISKCPFLSFKYIIPPKRGKRHHKKSFTNPSYALSNRKSQCNIKWAILMGNLCNKEKLFIFKPGKNSLLGTKSKVFSSCMHKKKCLAGKYS